MTAVAKRRPRRIAADEALAWARNLRLGNPYAKLTLSMLTLYVNGDGICFVGIDALAEDTELSADTVRKRLAWLEGVGAIARFAQWIDANGRRNSEGKGKRTSDEIRLLIDADPDVIEARAAGDDVADVHDIGPSHQQGLNPDQDSVSPAVALCQPSDSGKGQDSSNQEPEEKNPPNPPSGGGPVVDQELEDCIGEFGRLYPSPITNLPRLRTALAAMTVDERKRVLTAVRGYAAFIAECDRKNKHRAVKDADRWVTSGMWQGYLLNGEKAESQAQRVSVPVESVDGRAWRNICAIGRATRPMVISDCYSLRRALTPQELAFAEMPPESEWQFLISGEHLQNIGAWSEFFGEALCGITRAEFMQDRGIGAAMQRGARVPWPWPPRKDGSICTGPPDNHLSDQDLQEFK